MRVLVYGGRDWTDERRTFDALDKFRAQYPIQILIHGGAIGADSLAGKWAVSRGVHSARVDALWDYYKKSAGPIRNGRMMLLSPQMAVEFPGGRGTADMREKLQTASVPIYAPYPFPTVLSAAIAPSAP